MLIHLDATQLLRTRAQLSHNLVSFNSVFRIIDDVTHDIYWHEILYWSVVVCVLTLLKSSIIFVVICFCDVCILEEELSRRSAVRSDDMDVVNSMIFVSLSSEYSTFVTHLTVVTIVLRIDWFVTVVFSILTDTIFPSWIFIVSVWFERRVYRWSFTAPYGFFSVFFISLFFLWSSFSVEIQLFQL